MYIHTRRSRSQLKLVNSPYRSGPVQGSDILLREACRVQRSSRSRQSPLFSIWTTGVRPPSIPGERGTSSHLSPSLGSLLWGRCTSGSGCHLELSQHASAKMNWEANTLLWLLVNKSDFYRKTSLTPRQNVYIAKKRKKVLFIILSYVCKIITDIKKYKYSIYLIFFFFSLLDCKFVHLPACFSKGPT